MRYIHGCSPPHHGQVVAGLREVNRHWPDALRQHEANVLLRAAARGGAAGDVEAEVALVELEAGAGDAGELVLGGTALRGAVGGFGEPSSEMCFV